MQRREEAIEGGPGEFPVARNVSGHRERTHDTAFRARPLRG
jgi:hypothetical protein